MSTLRIPENVVEATAKAIHGSLGNEQWPQVEGHREHWEALARAGLQAALAEWGATEERGSVAHAAHGWAVPVLEGRLVTPWTPVDGGQ